MSCLGHSLGESHPSAEKQFVYSTAPADWATWVLTLYYGWNIVILLSIFVYRILYVTDLKVFQKIIITYIYIYIHEDYHISFQTFFIWALLLIVHTWNSRPLWINLLQLQCTCCTVPTTNGRPHGSPLLWACQWPSSQPLSSPQLSHNDSLWA